MPPSHQLASDANQRRLRMQAKDELRHRGELLVAYPGAALWQAVGGGGVVALIKDLYRRIEQDELLRVEFPHFNSEDATRFFI